VLGIEQLQQESHLLTSVLPEANEILRILAEQSSVVCRILNDVLSIQRIEEGGLMLEKEAFDFEEMVLTTMRSFSAPLQEKDIQLKFNSIPLAQQLKKQMQMKNIQTQTPAAGERIYAKGDKYRLRQVLGKF